MMTVLQKEQVEYVPGTQLRRDAERRVGVHIEWF